MTLDKSDSSDEQRGNRTRAFITGVDANRKRKGKGRDREKDKKVEFKNIVKIKGSFDEVINKSSMTNANQDTRAPSTSLMKKTSTLDYV